MREERERERVVVVIAAACEKLLSFLLFVCARACVLSEKGAFYQKRVLFCIFRLSNFGEKKARGERFTHAAGKRRFRLLDESRRRRRRRDKETESKDVFINIVAPTREREREIWKLGEMFRSPRGFWIRCRGFLSLSVSIQSIAGRDWLTF